LATLGFVKERGRVSMECPQCHAKDCTEIQLNLTGEETVEFFSCRRCEAKWWEREGDTIALDEVLTLAAKKDSPRN
jgi:Zn ribbon nucleic-acid-binding protein